MYQIRYDNRRVKKELKKLPKKERDRIIEAIETRLVNFNPRTRGIKYIKALNRYRLREGDFRILFVVENDTIRIEKIKDRKDVYR